MDPSGNGYEPIDEALGLLFVAWDSAVLGYDYFTQASTAEKALDWTIFGVDTLGILPGAPPGAGRAVAFAGGGFHVAEAGFHFARAGAVTRTAQLGIQASRYALKQPSMASGGRQQRNYPRDEQTNATQNFSANFRSEREARNFARQKVGRNPVSVGENKLRSANGKWQYRAKPVDTRDNHIHLEELDPKTGDVIRNYHLRYPSQ
jgi:hypothetical protein